MAADRTLAEDDQVAGQDVGALDRDPDRRRAVQIAQVVERAIDHRLAGMDVHGVVDGGAQPVGGAGLHDRRDDRELAPLIQPGAGQPTAGIEQVRRARQPGEAFLDALEAGNRNAELLPDPGIGAGAAGGQRGAGGGQ